MAEIKLLNTNPQCVNIVVDATELQMLHEAVRRVQPFADLSPELRTACKTLEHDLRQAIETLRVQA